jgi:hypothetical protein
MIENLDDLPWGDKRRRLYKEAREFMQLRGKRKVYKLRG